MRGLACALLVWFAASAPSPRACASTDATGFEALVSAFQTRLDSLQLERTIPSNRIRMPGLATGYFQPIPYLPQITTLRDGTFRFNPASEWTGGGLATNPQDLVRWARVLYEGRALRGPYLDDLLSDPNRIESDVSYGLGVYISETRLGRAFGHGVERRDSSPAR